MFGKHFKDSLEHLIVRKRVIVPIAVLAFVLSTFRGFPEAGVEPVVGASSDGTPDILLLGPGGSLEELASDAPPVGVLNEMRSVMLTDSVRKILSRYPRFLSPREQEILAQTLVEQGSINDIDPLFLAAVIRVESAFSRDAVSDKGARGLMQLMPATGEEMAQRLGMRWQGPDALDDPEYNLRLGAYYLRRLLDRYHGSYRQALTAYNRGPRNLRHIKRNHGRLGRKFTGYFRKIHKVYKKYKRTLGPGAALLSIG